MLNKIKSLFFNHPKKVEDDAGSLNYKSNTVSFIISDQEPYVKIQVIDTEDIDAKIYATMLFNISKGTYTDVILSILMDMSKEDKNINAFVIKLLSEWKSIITRSTNNTSVSDDPEIKPTHFFNMVNKHE